MNRETQRRILEERRRRSILRRWALVRLSRNRRSPYLAYLLRKEIRIGRRLRKMIRSLDR